MNHTYEQRAVACVEKALSGLGLRIELEHWQHGDMERPEPVIVVRGSCALSTPAIQERGFLAFEEEFSDREPWPLLAMYTNGDRKEAPEPTSNRAAS